MDLLKFEMSKSEWIKFSLLHILLFGLFGLLIFTPLWFIFKGLYSGIFEHINIGGMFEGDIVVLSGRSIKDGENILKLIMYLGSFISLVTLYIYFAFIRDGLQRIKYTGLFYMCYKSYKGVLPGFNKVPHLAHLHGGEQSISILFVPCLKNYCICVGGTEQSREQLLLTILELD